MKNKKLKERQKKFTDANYPKTEVLLESAKEQEKKEKDSKSVDEDELDEELDSFDFDIRMHEGLRIIGDWIDILEDPKRLEEK